MPHKCEIEIIVVYIVFPLVLLLNYELDYRYVKLAKCDAQLHEPDHPASLINWRDFID